MIESKTLKNCRKYQYDYHAKRFPYLDDWKKSPYTWFKSRFYMETSAILVYFLLKTNIKPNAVTIIYGLAGVIGGVLLAIPHNYTITIAVSIFFTKGILDWSDGHLARATGQTSLTGAILDEFGALLNSLGLKIGLGFYVAQKTGIDGFYFLIPLIPFFYAAHLVHFSRIFILDSCITTEKISKMIEEASPDLLTDKAPVPIEKQTGRLQLIYNAINNFLDDRARSVDFICLLIVIEIYTEFSVTWLIFLLLLVKQFLIFAGSFYAVVMCGWAEKKEHEKILEILRFSRTPKT